MEAIIALVAFALGWGMSQARWRKAAEDTKRQLSEIPERTIAELKRKYGEDFTILTASREELKPLLELLRSGRTITVTMRADGSDGFLIRSLEAVPEPPAREPGNS
jgi:hypothetical protein